MAARLGSARYGKDNVRVCKVEREQSGFHNVVEMTICVLLEGEIETSYVVGSLRGIESVKRTQVLTLNLAIPKPTTAWLLLRTR